MITKIKPLSESIFLKSSNESDMKTADQNSVMKVKARPSPLLVAQSNFTGTANPSLISSPFAVIQQHRSLKAPLFIPIDIFRIIKQVVTTSLSNEQRNVNGTAIGNDSIPSSLISPRFPPEPQSGGVEYKWTLCDVSRDKLAHLITQLHHRVKDGNGKALYVLGIPDEGGNIGCSWKALVETLCVLYTSCVWGGFQMRIERILHGDDAEGEYRGERVVRQFTQSMEDDSCIEDCMTTNFSLAMSSLDLEASTASSHSSNSSSSFGPNMTGECINVAAYGYTQCHCKSCSSIAHQGTRLIAIVTCFISDNARSNSNATTAACGCGCDSVLVNTWTKCGACLNNGTCSSSVLPASMSLSAVMLVIHTALHVDNSHLDEKYCFGMRTKKQLNDRKYQSSIALKNSNSNLVNKFSASPAQMRRNHSDQQIHVKGCDSASVSSSSTNDTQDKEGVFGELSVSVSTVFMHSYAAYDSELFNVCEDNGVEGDVGDVGHTINIEDLFSDSDSDMEFDSESSYSDEGDSDDEDGDEFGGDDIS